MTPRSAKNVRDFCLEQRRARRHARMTYFVCLWLQKLSATGLDQSRRVQDAFCGVSVSPAITETKEPQEASGLQSVMEMPQATRLTWVDDITDKCRSGNFTFFLVHRSLFTVFCLQTRQHATHPPPSSSPTPNTRTFYPNWFILSYMSKATFFVLFCFVLCKKDNFCDIPLSMRLLLGL